MRILHIFDHSVPVLDGYSTRSLSIIREQRKRGWNTIHLTSTKHNGLDDEYEEVNGLHFYRSKKKYPSLYKIPVLGQLACVYDTYQTLLKIVPKEKPDVLHAHSPALNGLAAIKVAKHFGLPVVYEVRAFWEDAAVDQGTCKEGDLRYKLTRYLENRVFKRVGAITAICEGLKNDIDSRKLNKPVVVIPNAVDVDSFQTHSDQNKDSELVKQLGLTNKTVIGFIGSFYDYEGLDILIQAMPGIIKKNPEIICLLVGGGLEADNLKAQVKSLGLEKNILFTGKVPFSNVGQYYSLIDVLIYPRKNLRLTELVTPLKPLEAMAQKKLFIASDVGGHKELIRQGETGMLFESGNINSLIKTLFALLDDTELQQTLTHKGREFVEKERNWKNSIARYQDVYQPLLKKKMKILTFTTLYPNNEQIRHGIFIEQRVKHLKEKQSVEIKVVAPVPWFPLKNNHFKIYGKFARIAKKECREGIDIFHPRYPVIPKIGMTLAPLIMAIWIYPQLRKIIKSGYDFDVIDAHFFYPDGVAAVLLGKWLNKKVVVTARGTDISVYPDKYYLPGKMINWAINNSHAVVTVCQALADKIESLKIRQKNIYVLRNGVDLELFKPVIDREALRKKYNVDGTVLISVGNLVELKGHHLIIKALADLPDMTLLLLGSGPMEAQLKQVAKQHQVENKVRFIGVVTQDLLAEYYAISDCLILASSREGWANVLLESMACGTPVVATAIWGTPEVVASEDAGVLIQERSAEGIVNGVQQLLSHYPERQKVRKYAEQFSWDKTCRGINQLFKKIVLQPL